MILYELVNFEGAYSFEAQRIRNLLSSGVPGGSRWVEWSPVLSSLVEVPDISIVSSRNMFPRTLRKIMEAANGRAKIHYGPQIFGFEYLNIDNSFNAEQFETLFSESINRREENDGVYRSGIWQTTIPMPLPIARNA